MKKLLLGLFGGFVVATVVYAASGTIQTWTGKGSRRNTVEFEIVSSSVGSAADLLPGTTSTNSIGSLTRQIKDVYVAASLTLPRNAAPKTNVTPTAAGQIIYNTTANQLCVSTGTLISQWAQVADLTLSCSN